MCEFKKVESSSECIDQECHDLHWSPGVGRSVRFRLWGDSKCCWSGEDKHACRIVMEKGAKKWTLAR